MSSLPARLSGGITAAALRSLPADWPYLPGRYQPQPLPELTPLFEVRKARGLTPEQVDARLADLAAALAGSRSLLLLALFSPDVLPALIAQTAGPQTAGPRGADPVGQWMGTCWVGEACWQALDMPLSSRGFARGDRELLRPLAARLRFLTLTEPMRHRGDAASYFVRDDGPPDGPGGSDAVRVFGTGGWTELVGRCRTARQEWMACLAAYQSHPFLSRAAAGEVEQDLRLLVFRDRRRDGPLVISAAPLERQVPLTAEDAAVIEEVSERHLLPRFDLRSTAVLAAWGATRGARFWRRAVALTTGLVWLGMAVCCAVLQVHLAVPLALAFYVLIGAGALAFGPTWAAPWLLRVPAAAAVGVIALVSFLPGGWVQTPRLGWAAALILAGSACGYLLVEARNHGVTGWGLARPVVVAVLGAAHALAVSVVALVAVAPAFIANGAALATAWHRPGYGRAGMVLLLATAWCLAVGVFSQILWDDRPITSPLAHMSWRSR